MLIIQSEKTNYDAKILEIKKHILLQLITINLLITTTYYNKSTKDIVANNIKSEGSVKKSDVVRFISNAGLDKKKVATSAAKAELKSEQDKIIKLQTFNSNYFRDKSHF